MYLKIPHRISAARTLDACMTCDAARRSTEAPRPLLITVVLHCVFIFILLQTVPVTDID